MKRIIGFTLIFMLIAITLLGCQSIDNEDSEVILDPNKEVKEINIIKLSDNEDPPFPL